MYLWPPLYHSPALQNKDAARKYIPNTMLPEMGYFVEAKGVRGGLNLYMSSESGTVRAGKRDWDSPEITVFDVDLFLGSS